MAVSMPLTSTQPSRVIIPDLVSHCSFQLRHNAAHDEATHASEQWLNREGKLDERKQQIYHGLRAGTLASQCYPNAPPQQLRVCCDFLIWLFHLDDLTDDMDNMGTSGIGDVIMNGLYYPNAFETRYCADRMARSYWRRLIEHRTASAGAQQRFVETMDFFFQAITMQAIDRKRGSIPDLESYISDRRETSGCKPCFALIEYANNLRIPDEVIDHPCIRALCEAANDLVWGSNDIFSYNVEQARGDSTHNMIPIVMYEQGLDLQAAFDFVGVMCASSIDRFNSERKNLPSWGTAIDRDVATYVDGLADWIVGSLHWSFSSERYFGKDGAEIKRTRVLCLSPRTG